jgi:hypothetical protein
MRFAGLKFMFEICLQLQLEACWCGVIMAFKYQVEVEVDNEKYFWDRKMNLREDIMKYDYAWSSYGTVQLRYGGFSMESILALAL